MKKIGFFEETEGNLSMNRLIAFFNALSAVFVTITGSMIFPVIALKCLKTDSCDLQVVFNSMSIGYDYITLVFGLWGLAYAGKNSQKYLERLNEAKGK
jgi:hypothetical protein